MNGKSNLQVYIVLALCNVLEVKIGDLFDRRDDVFQTECREKNMICKEYNLLDGNRNLSNQKKGFLKIYMDMLQAYEGELLKKMINNSE